jgi:hypothetical protein
MKKLIVTAACLVAGASATAAGALTVPNPYFGSDVLYNVTNGAIAGAGLTPTNAYVGGGTSVGQTAVATGAAANATQQTEPIANMFTSPICSYGLTGSDAGSGSKTINATGIVIGLDAVAILASTATGASVACNAVPGPSGDNVGAGLAYSGSTVFGATGTSPAPSQNWKYVLALVYGGKDLTTGVVDCGQTARRNLVNNWSALFQNGCANGATVCSNAAHKNAGDGTHAPLWHAFRRDDGAGVSSVFATLLSLTPSVSQSALNGFGTSPFCNALNWDTQSANKNCAFPVSSDGLNHDQWTGPGGIVDPLSQCSTTTGVCGLPGTGNHRRPPPHTWGDYPDGNATTNGADVLATDLQDNDPIRRTCIGGGTGNAAHAAEEVCNIDGTTNNHGTLGLVLAVPTTVFIPRDLGLQQYPTAPTGNFISGLAPNILNCAPKGASVHNGQCPNGDASPGGLCQIPTTATGSGGTTQVLSSNADVAGFVVRDGTVAPTAVNVLLSDGRQFNAHLHDGTNVDGSVGYIKQKVPNGTANPILRDFVGGYGRIHTVATVVNGSATAVGCQSTAVDDQLGCLAAADPCSISLAGDSGEGWNTRADGSLTPPSTVASALTNGLRVAQLEPSAANVQSLGVQTVAAGNPYQLARKLLFGSVIGFANINAGTAGQADTATGELALGEWESAEANVAPLLAADGFFTVGAQGGQLGVGHNGGSANTPFCEDFNQSLVCGAAAPANDNACARNPAGIPGDPSVAPTSSTTSTVCGNGVQEAFEECDPGPTATATCSSACRCAGITSYLPNGSGGYACQ